MDSHDIEPSPASYNATTYIGSTSSVGKSSGTSWNRARRGHHRNPSNIIPGPGTYNTEKFMGISIGGALPKVYYVIT